VKRKRATPKKKAKRAPSGAALSRSAAKLAELGGPSQRLRELAVLCRSAKDDLDIQRIKTEKQICVELDKGQREKHEDKDVEELIRLNRRVLKHYEAGGDSAVRASMAPTLSYKPGTETPPH
jgi:hypothetical protein